MVGDKTYEAAKIRLTQGLPVQMRPNKDEYMNILFGGRVY